MPHSRALQPQTRSSHSLQQVCLWLVVVQLLGWCKAIWCGMSFRTNRSHRYEFPHQSANSSSLLDSNLLAPSFMPPPAGLRAIPTLLLLLLLPPFKAVAAGRLGSAAAGRCEVVGTTSRSSHPSSSPPQPSLLLLAAAAAAAAGAAAGLLLPMPIFDSRCRASRSA